MMRTKKSSLTLAAGLACLAAAGCASHAPSAVSADYLQGTALDRNPIGVAKRTEFLEIAIHPEASQLSLKDRAQIQNFVMAYRKSGHGPLIMSLPQSTANPQLAIQAVVEARAIAWDNGVEYEEIEGTAYGEGSMFAEPMILAFQTYEAIAPDCPSLATQDFSDLTSNNELPTLGCSVRTNMAAMIADPGDLLGLRALDQGDPVRRGVILEKFREGESTSAVRSAAESGAVSDAVSE